MRYTVIIAGPTAVGKTDLAIEIAGLYGAEIISADSRQIYKELSIGVAKPSPAQLAEIKHHFISSVSVTESYNAGVYAEQAQVVLHELAIKAKVTVVCGGSGLYIRALTDGLDDLPQIAPEVRQQWIKIYEQHGLDFLGQMLEKADPDYYQMVDKKNPQRIMRALEVTEVGGRPYSTYLTKKTMATPHASVLVPLILELPRTSLYERINQRVEQMMQAGLLHEVQNLVDYRDYPALNTVGYKELFAYLAGEISMDSAISDIKQHTRNYAKRQVTWFNKYLAGPRFHPEQKGQIFAYLKSKIV